MGLSRYSGWMGIGLGLIGLAISGTARADSVGNIRLEGAMPADQVALLKADREVLASLQIPESNTDLKTLLGISSNSSSALTAWLEARVQAVVTETYDRNQHLLAYKAPFAYPNSTLFPSVEVAPPSNPTGHGVLIMANIGVSTYESGKRRGQLLGMDIDGVGIIRMSSPRSGVIQVGPGLFSPPHPVDASSPTAVANSIARLGTFFHESRHSDGHGQTLGFYHALCPPGHALQNLNACDRNLNGPYTVGAQMIKAMAESCKDCTTAQREALRLQYIDSFGRQLTTQLDGTTPVVAWDATPEGTR